MISTPRTIRPATRWRGFPRGRILLALSIPDRRPSRAGRSRPFRRTRRPLSLFAPAGGDKVHAVWAEEYFSAMLQAGIPNVEMHIYARGHHPGDRTGPMNRSPPVGWPIAALSPTALAGPHGGLDEGPGLLQQAGCGDASGQGCGHPCPCAAARATGAACAAAQLTPFTAPAGSASRHRGSPGRRANR